MLIAHEAQVNRVIEGLSAHAANPATYFVVGTLGSVKWRGGLSGCVTIEEVRKDMADFKAYMRVEITPRHWALKDSPED